MLFGATRWLSVTEGTDVNLLSNEPWRRKNIQEY